VLCISSLKFGQNAQNVTGSFAARPFTPVETCLACIVSRCGEASDIKEGADDIRIDQVPADCIDGLLREIRLHIDVVDNSLGLTGD
jgi:hypothetical protein